MKTNFACLFTAVAGLAFSASVYGAPGDLYVADFGSGTIFKFAPDGTKSTFASGLDGPEGLAFDNKGNLYEADGHTGTIFKFAPDGTKSTFASGLNSPAGLAFDGSGNLFEADYSGGGALFKFAPDGTKSTFASALVSPSGIAFDTSGNLYSTDGSGGGAILKFAPDGTKTTFASGLNVPAGLAFDSSGNLYATDSGTDGAIFKFAPDGTKSTFTSGLRFFVSLAFDSSGNLFVAGAAPNTIVRITPAGVKSVVASGLDGPVALAFEPVVEKLRNVSARGLVGNGDNVLIGGFILGGNSLANNSVLLRAIGPSLSRFGVSNPLSDPTLELRNSDGVLIARNDNWQDTQATQITATGLAPPDAHESAIFATLPAGNFTAIVRGAGSATGTALVEVYNTP